MDKTQIILTETFRSESQTERKENLQHAVDQYIRLTLKNGGPSTKDDPEYPAK